MVENIKAVNNPLTIIAIFAGLAEIAGTVVLAVVSPAIQQIFVWFVMFFPAAIVIFFFLTLNWNSKVLYAPSDFRNEENYMHTIAGKQVERKLDAALNLVETAKLEGGADSSLSTGEIGNDVIQNLEQKSAEEQNRELTEKMSEMQASLKSIGALLNEAKRSVNHDLPNETPGRNASSNVNGIKLLSSLELNVLEALKSADRPLLIPEIADLMEISPAHSAEIVNKMASRNLVSVDARGKVRMKTQLIFKS